MMTTINADDRRSLDRHRRRAAQRIAGHRLHCVGIHLHLICRNAAGRRGRLGPRVCQPENGRGENDRSTRLAQRSAPAPRLRNANNDSVSLPNLQNAAVEFRAICAGRSEIGSRPGSICGPPTGPLRAIRAATRRRRRRGPPLERADRLVVRPAVRRAVDPGSALATAATDCAGPWAITPA